MPKCACGPGHSDQSWYYDEEYSCGGLSMDRESTEASPGTPHPLCSTCCILHFAYSKDVLVDRYLRVPKKPIMSDRSSEVSFGACCISIHILHVHWQFLLKCIALCPCDDHQLFLDLVKRGFTMPARSAHMSSDRMDLLKASAHANSHINTSTTSQHRSSMHGRPSTRTMSTRATSRNARSKSAKKLGSERVYM